MFEHFVSCIIVLSYFVMARVPAATGQGHYNWHSAAKHQHPPTVCSTRSRRHNRLLAYDGRPRHRRLLYRLFLAAPVARCCSVADVRGGGFFGSRLHQLPPRLLQCLAVRHCRWPTPATAISPGRSCASGDWNPAHWPHYTGSPVTSLAAGATMTSSDL